MFSLHQDSDTKEKRQPGRNPDKFQFSKISTVLPRVNSGFEFSDQTKIQQFFNRKNYHTSKILCVRSWRWKFFSSNWPKNLLLFLKFCKVPTHISWKLRIDFLLQGFNLKLSSFGGLLHFKMTDLAPGIGILMGTQNSHELPIIKI